MLFVSLLGLVSLAHAVDSRYVFLDARSPARDVVASFQFNDQKETNLSYLKNLAQLLKTSSFHPRLNVLLPESSPILASQIDADRVIPWTAKADSDYNRGETLLWVQDNFVPFFDQRSKRPVIFSLPYREQESEWTNVARFLGVSLLRPTVKEHVQGGNLAVFPGNVLATGSSVPAVFIDEFVRNLGSRHKMNVNTAWLDTGHVDEIFSLIPTKVGGACNFAIAVASPASALALIAEELPSTIVDPSSPWSPTHTPDEVQLPTGDCLTDLEWQTRLGASITVQELSKCIDLTRANLKYERLIQGMTQTLGSLISEASGCKNISFVKLPVLFRPMMIHPEYGTSEDHAAAVNPNEVNFLAAAPDLLIVPEQFAPSFVRAIDSQFSRLSVSYRFLDDRLYHRKGGEVHCSTQVLR